MQTLKNYRHRLALLLAYVLIFVLQMSYDIVYQVVLALIALPGVYWWYNKLYEIWIKAEKKDERNR